MVENAAPDAVQTVWTGLRRHKARIGGFAVVAAALAVGVILRDARGLFFAVALLAGVALATNAWGLRARVPGFNSSNNLLAAGAWLWMLVVVVAPFLPITAPGSQGIVATDPPRAPVARSSILPPASVTLSAPMVPPGGAMTVAWQGIASPSATDWVGLYPVEAADTIAALAQRPTTGETSGSVTLSVPSGTPPGPYEVRLFADGTAARLGVSPLLTVAPLPPASVTLSAPMVPPGGAMTVAWQGIASPSATDWVGLYPVEAADTIAALAQRPTTGETSGSVTLGVPSGTPPGPYEVRLFADGTAARLGVSPLLTVAPLPPASVTLSAPMVPPGGAMTVAWQGIASPSATDWVGLYPVEAADTIAALAQRPTTGETSGSVTLSVPSGTPPGPYEVRLFADGTAARLGVSPLLTVAPLPPASVTLSAPMVPPGGAMTVAWQGIASPSATDWVGLYPVEAADTIAALAQRPTTGETSGSVTLSVPSGTPPGPYEVRLFADGTAARLGVSPLLTVAPLPPASVTLSAPMVPPGGAMTVAWQGIASPSATDWVGLYPVEAADTIAALAQRPTTGETSGSVTLSVPSGTPPGPYEVRLFADGTAARLGVSPLLTVAPLPPASVTLSAPMVPPGGAMTVAWQGIASPSATDWVGLYPVEAADTIAALAQRPTTGEASGSVTLGVPSGTPPGAYEVRLFADGTAARLGRSNPVTIR